MQFHLSKFARFFCLAGALFLGTAYAASAKLTYTTEPIDSSRQLILVAGAFDPDENFSQLATIARGLDGKIGIVLFNSPGGNPSKAIEMGRMIRTLGLATIQFRGAECASACALAFMGGVLRAADPGSIGVHKSSFSDDSGLSVKDAVSYVQHQTAETITYLTEMGVDPALLELSLRYEPDDMRYLSKSEMEKYRVTNFDTATGEIAAKSTPATMERPASPMPSSEAGESGIPLATSGQIRMPNGEAFLMSAEDPKSAKLKALRNGTPVQILSVGGRWYFARSGATTGYLHDTWVKVDQFMDDPFETRFIQIASFATLDEANRYIRQSVLPLDAYLTTTNWFAVTISGTLNKGPAIELLKRLKQAKSIPSDSFATYGNTYITKACCQ
jgi:hypothetical protein